MSSQLKNTICAMTMVRNDENFLRKWVEYYGGQLGNDHLYIYFDGLDQTIPEYCSCTHVERIAHVVCNVAEGDRRRAAFLSAKAAEKLHDYEMVIGTDVDEFLIVDPLLGSSLSEYLSGIGTSYPAISALGIDVGQNVREEDNLDVTKPFLEQRHYAQISTRYSKASVLCKPVAWGSGFHRVKSHNFHIVEGLYLFHFGSADIGMLQKRMADQTKIKEGWSRHFNKRARPIKLASEAKARNWDRTIEIARRIQNILRPPYAWNKPAMFNASVLVRIPDRFKGII